MLNECEKGKFEKKILTIWKSLILVEMCFDTFYGISDNLQDKSRIGFFHFARLVSWRTGIVELAKLLSYSNDDKYSICRLLACLSPKEYYGKLKINQDSIEKWEGSLAEQKYNIEIIKTLRDEVYAHSDKKSLGSDLDYDFPEKESIMQLLDLSKEIIVDLYSNVFDKQIDTENLVEISKEITGIFKGLEEIEQLKYQHLIGDMNSFKRKGSFDL